jgi:hypothetical protein
MLRKCARKSDQRSAVKADKEKLDKAVEQLVG